MVRSGAASTPYYNTDASELNVDVHWCAVPVERCDAVEALNRGARVVISDPGRPERVAHHHVDQARAWVLQGDRERALGELNAARGVSPSQVRGHPSVRETAWSLLRQPRVSAGAVEFARWVGLKPN